MAEHPKKEDASAASEPIEDPQDLEAELNRSLGDVLDLLGNQVEYLKESLEFLRLSEDVKDRDARIRWHVHQIDIRQDRMDEIKAMMLTDDNNEVH